MDDRSIVGHQMTNSFCILKGLSHFVQFMPGFLRYNTMKGQVTFGVIDQRKILSGFVSAIYDDIYKAI